MKTIESFVDRLKSRECASPQSYVSIIPQKNSPPQDNSLYEGYHRDILYRLLKPYYC